MFDLFTLLSQFQVYVHHFPETLLQCPYILLHVSVMCGIDSLVGCGISHPYLLIIYWYYFGLSSFYSKILLSMNRYLSFLFDFSRGLFHIFLQVWFFLCWNLKESLKLKFGLTPGFSSLMHWSSSQLLCDNWIYVSWIWMCQIVCSKWNVWKPSLLVIVLIWIVFMSM